MKKFFLIFLFVAIAIATQAQDSQYRQYRALVDQLNVLLKDSTTTYSQLKQGFASIDSLYNGKMPNYMLTVNYMNCALWGGDTATFRQQLFRAMKWKSWNEGVLDYYEDYAFLKECDDWSLIDSLSHIYGSKKIYPYMDSLAVIVQRDQAVRKAWDAPGLSRQEADSLGQIWHVIDSVNFAHFEELISQYGFPTWERVGFQGADNAWLIAQHTHLPFLHWFTSEYRKAVRDSNANIRHLAYLEDRDRTGRGLPQRYGTQFMSVPTDDGFERTWQLPIADIKHVNRRREQMFMEPLEEYIANFSQSGRISSDSQFHPIDADYTQHYYNGGVYDFQTTGTVDAQCWMANGDVCSAAMIYCENCSQLYPFVADLKRYLYCMLDSPSYAPNKDKFVSSYEILERMVLCGYTPDQFFYQLPDSLTARLNAEYDELRADYLSCLDDEGNAEFLNALKSRDAFVSLLQSGRNYHRYDTDGWNYAYSSLYDMTKGLTKEDYKDFFALLWREVVRGNLYAEDYASLYDSVHYRLFGKDYYGTLAMGSKVKTIKHSQLDKRRQSICLPPYQVSRQLGHL